METKISETENQELTGAKLVGSWVLIVAITFLLYHLTNLTPLDWYKHFVYLAQAFLQGRVDIWGFPEFYQDLVRVGTKVYLPFPPMPAVILLPWVAIAGTATSQVGVSKLVGAVNVGLMWLVLNKLKIDRRLQGLLTIFFGFGTVHWYAVQMGTTWFFAHVVAVGFMLLALLAYFNSKSPVLVGILVGAAGLSREPMLGGGIFFMLMWLKQRQWKKLIGLGAGGGIMLSLLLTYNGWRFGNIFNEGYGPVVEQYRQSGIQYTIWLKYFPQAERFKFLDARNIPLHVYTMLVMPPEISFKPLTVKPSVYGMSLILTSPLLLWLVGKPVRKKRIFWASAAAVGVISVPILLHFTQGWVQFGYRFALDLMPFLIVMLALRINRATKLAVGLAAMSIIVNGWGIIWAQRLGW